MKNRILTCLIPLSFLVAQSIACDISGKTGFAPTNDRRISVWDKNNNGMTIEKFDEIINRVVDVYKPIVNSKGGNLRIMRNWYTDTVNASAERDGEFWVVNMYGGLARSPELTDDGFMGVICHELGHHIGGAPKKKSGIFASHWASNEGQSDYFATLKCMRKILQNDDNIAIVNKMQVDTEAKIACERVYQSANEVALCERISMASKSLAIFLNSFRNGSVSFNTPDTSVVSKTYNDHPSAQCRLDTYFQGVLCDKSVDNDVSDSNTTQGTCTRGENLQYGARPLCWYKPGFWE